MIATDGSAHPMDRRADSMTRTIIMTPRTISEVIGVPSRMEMASQLRMMFMHPRIVSPART